MMTTDSMTSLVMNLMGGQGRAGHDRFTHQIITDGELAAMYRGDWLSRKIVDIPAKDAVSQWRSWQAEADQISAIEKVERDLKIVSLVTKARRWARLYGGSLIYLGDGTSNPERILPAKSKIAFAHVFAKHNVAYSEIERDVRSPWYGEPKFWQIVVDGATMASIHPSRVIKFVGAEVDENIGIASDGVWGESTLIAKMEPIKNVARFAGAIAELVHDAKGDVVQMGGLAEHLKTTEGAEAVQKYWSLVMLLKGLSGVTLLDAGDKDRPTTWDQKTYTFSGIPETLDRLMIMASGAADIPATRLFGMSPAGQNSTGESDTRNYHRTLETAQRLEIEPALAPLDEMIIRTALDGKRPSEIYYDWRPLHTPTPSELADLADKHAETAVRYYSIEGLDKAALAKGVGNRIIEDGIFPGFEQGVQPVPDPDDDTEADPTMLGDDGPGVDDEDMIDAFIATLEGRIARAFRDAIASLGDDDLATIAALLRDGREQEAVELAARGFAIVSAEITAAYSRSGEAVAATIRAAGAKGAAFDLLRAAGPVDAAKTEFVGYLKEGQRDAFRTLASIETGAITPQSVKPFIGLSSRDAEWVGTFRQGLIDLDRSVLDRVYRDGRMDATIRKALETGNPLSDEQVAKMSGRYAERLQRHRTKQAARFEAQRAFHEAQDETYRQAIEDRAVAPEKLDQTWRTNRDGRERQSHAELDGVTIPFGEAWQGRGGPIRYPGDPQAALVERIECRCRRTIRVKK